MAVPMFFGIAAIILFTVVDTYFVGQLGPNELAAMGFCFPVAFFIQNLAMGMGTGATSVISRAIGAGDQERVKRLTTHSLILALVLVVTVALSGLFGLEKLFTAMGAKPELLPLIKDYMVPWFLGVGLLVIPMVGNSALRATGDTKTPALIMMAAGLVNVILDPLLIFGLGPFPRLELMGAALATIGSWLAAFLGAFYFLHLRYKMLTNPFCPGIWASWQSILKVGIPAAATNVLVPLSTGILTKMVAEYGKEAVGAYGVAGRIEALSMIGIFALAASMSPFAGQNYGARQCDRIRQALRVGMGFSLAWGFGVATLLAIFGAQIAGLFSEKQVVIDALVPYLSLVPWSYGLLGLALMVTNTFNAIDRPFSSSVVIVIRLFVFAIPLASLGSGIGGLQGLYSGILAANVLTGFLALGMVWKALAQIERSQG
jgi:putative MATE family efflux protein